MRKLHSMMLLAALVAGATACSAGSGSTPSTGTATSELSVAHGVLAHRHHDGAIIPRLTPTATLMESTTPPNGDQNPYGVAFVPCDFPERGPLRPGDILVSNFNNSVALGNLQGTGTTIVRVNPGASPDVFFQDANLPGLSTALGVLQRGFVIVGNVPSLDGTGMCTGNQDNVGAGALTVLDRHGNIVATLNDRPFVAGPWDLTIDDDWDRATVYVSNVLTGTVTRIKLQVGKHEVFVERETQIASGYAHRCDPAAFVLGPTGLALDKERDVLYVSSAADNAIFAVDDASDRRRDAGMGRAVVTDQNHLNGPLGLVRADNGNLISAQGDAFNPNPPGPSLIVEFTKDGDFVDQIQVDPNPGGAFGIALEQHGDDFRFAAVNDNVPTLDVWIVH